MKLTAVLLFVTALHVSACSVAQKVSLQGRNLPLEEAIVKLKQQTSLLFIYNDKDMAKTRPVTINVHDVAMTTVLDALFKDQPLTYEIQENTVFIVARPTTVFQSVDTSRHPAPPIDVHGRVVNENGQPLSGANVTIKESGKGTITNAKGEFEFPVPATSTLVVSFIGYATQQVKVIDNSKIQVYLAIAKNELDRVVVQGYGLTTQRLNTGSITTVTAEQIERHPVMNALAALQGTVPGLTIKQTSGFASAPFKAEIRGRSVIDGGQPSEPLYVVDGVPLTVLNIYGANYDGGSTGFLQTLTPNPAGGQSPFFSINPSDIESITVLKDADATAIYGSRGANGVIIITTKSGKPGKTKLDINVYQGASKVTGRYDLLSTNEYLQMRREAFKNDQTTYGIIPGFTVPDNGNAYDLLSWDTTRYTNWQNLMWGRTGKTTDLQVGISGGDKQNSFRVGGSYHHETGILSRSGADQRGSGQFNYTHKSLDQRLGISLTTLYSYTQSDLTFVAGNSLEAPDAPPVYNEQGKLNWSAWQPVPVNLSGWSGLFCPYLSKTGFLNSQLKFQYEIVKGLTASTQFGYSSMHNSQVSLVPISALNPFDNPKGSSYFGNSNITNTIIEPQLQYKTVISKVRLDLLLGASSQSVSSDATSLIGEGYINDNLLKSFNNAPSKGGTNAFGQYRYVAVFTRVNLNWDNKYLLNLSARRDGSSRFGAGRQFGSFGAVGAAWIFSEEDWFKDKLQGMSFGKLRASYGLTGNDQIGDYGYLTRWSAIGALPYQSSPSYAPLQHANPKLEWETNYKLEAALNVGFWHDRLSFELAWYRNRCGNQLVSEPLPGLTGFNTVYANLPATIQNQGVELTMNSKIVATSQVNLGIRFNIASNRNKLLAFPNLAQSPYASSFTVGQSLSIVRLLHYTGVDPQSGQYAYYDKNHNGAIDYSYNNGENDLYNKDLAIRFEGGFGIDFKYRGFQLDLGFIFRKQELLSGIYNGTPGSIELNQSVKVLDRWQKPGDKATFARYTSIPALSDILFNGYSDGVYSDGSYLRLRNLSMSYDLPMQWLKNAGMAGCKIYIRGENLFLLTRYNGLDPDVATLGSLPPSKIFTGGIQFNF